MCLHDRLQYCLDNSTNSEIEMAINWVLNEYSDLHGARSFVHGLEIWLGLREED